MPVRILVVDDFKPWRLKIATMIQSRRPEWQIIGESSDGLEAVQMAAELRPDLILLDVGIPNLNGIQVASQISKLLPQSKILFVSQHASAEVVQAALATGATGYLSKTDVARQLIIAVETVLRGERFLSKTVCADEHLDVPVCPDVPVTEISQLLRSQLALVVPSKEVAIGLRHEARFYLDDGFLLDDITKFAGAALKAGNSVIGVGSESLLESVLSRLQANCIDIGGAIEQGRYIALDIDHALSGFMINDLPDPARFSNYFEDLLAVASQHARGETRRVAVFGEGCGRLTRQGNPEAAVQIERLWNQLAAEYELEILCGYSLSCFQDKQSSGAFKRICAEHSAVHLQ
jgi:CheY-like chemotaxis protein